MMGRNNNNKKKRLVTMTGTAAAITLLVASIAVTGAAQLSYQQQSIIGGGFAGRGFITSAMIADNTIVSADLKDGSAVRSSDIVDGQVNTADLADDAVTTDKIRDGEVKEEDLDPSIELGGDGGSDFSLQATERSNTRTLMSQDDFGFVTLSVQCNADEVVTGGGYDLSLYQSAVSLISKRLDNGWTMTAFLPDPTTDVTVFVYAECLKVVNEEGTPG
ncbi:MAG: hypothetical protein ACREAS_10520 [Nitrososphaera sp.]